MYTNIEKNILLRLHGDMCQSIDWPNPNLKLRWQS